MRTYYSFSQLETFRKCPLKYKFKYIDHRESDLEGVEAFMGTRVHEALKELYGNLGHYRGDRASLLSYYERRWKSEWHGGVRIVSEGMAARDYFELGIGCIDAFCRRSYPFDGDRTMELEYWVEFELDGGSDRWFRGKVDRIALRPDGIYEIQDYKTGRLSSRFAPREDEQLSLYQIALQAMHPEAQRVDLVWLWLQHGQFFSFTRTESELAQVENSTNYFIDDIESERRFPANPSKLCDWCEFRDICPALSRPRQAW